MPLLGLSQMCMMRFTAIEVRVGYQTKNTNAYNSDQALPASA